MTSHTKGPFSRIVRDRQGGNIALDDVVAAYLNLHPDARIEDVLIHVHTLCPAWLQMRADVSEAYELYTDTRRVRPPNPEALVG